jgi:3-methyladenine DNA glycosylase AlkD
LNIKWARNTAEKLVKAIDADDKEMFWSVLNPVLDAKVPFPLLDEIGKLLGEAGKLDNQRYFDIIDEIVAADKMGGYVIVGQALAQFPEKQLEKSLNKAKEAVIKGKTWYVCDIVGERVFGQALVLYFESAVSVIQKMTALESQEVRRSIGVGVHFFAKRRPNDTEEMKRLLTVLLVLVEDRRVFVVKGVGWGLKTSGKHQPELIEEYLQETLKTKRVSKLLLRKATTYLDAKTKQKLVDLWQQAIQKNRLTK